MKIATPMINRHRSLSVTTRIASKNGNGSHSSDLELVELRGQLAAINKAQAVIEFNLDGTVYTANDNFLKTLGYTLDEIKGKHHSMFVEPAYRDSAEYRQFWRDLNDGKFQAAEYKRIGKGGREVWIQASYNPIFDASGKPFKVVKFATDVTATKLRNADFQGQIAAVGKTQAVIEFNLDGTVITANENFLKTLGYTLDEIKGRHHGMFVEASYRESAEYRQFWRDLNEGKYQTAEYRRVGKGGKLIWIQGSYNPILDLNGKPFKVVKFATNITGRKRSEEAISQVQAIIEFNLDGTVTVANEIFLKTMGYSTEEIKGRHHSMFVEPAYRESAEYRQFWRDLNDGKFQAADFKRIAKGGREVWLQAIYNPVFDEDGRPYKVVKNAIDITLRKKMEEGLKVTIDAVNKNAQALASAAEELTATSQQMSSNSEETATQSNVVAAASEQVSKNVATVATSAEEMSASVKEIANRFLALKLAESNEGKIVKSWYAAYFQAAERFTRFVGASTLVSELTPDHFAGFLASRGGEGVNKTVQCIRALFNHATGEGWCKPV